MDWGEWAEEVTSSRGKYCAVSVGGVGCCIFIARASAASTVDPRRGWHTTVAFFAVCIFREFKKRLFMGSRTFRPATAFACPVSFPGEHALIHIFHRLNRPTSTGCPTETPYTVPVITTCTPEPRLDEITTVIYDKCQWYDGRYRDSVKRDSGSDITLACVCVCVVRPPSVWRRRLYYLTGNNLIFSRRKYKNRTRFALRVTLIYR